MVRIYCCFWFGRCLRFDWRFPVSILWPHVSDLAYQNTHQECMTMSKAAGGQNLLSPEPNREQVGIATRDQPGDNFSIYMLLAGFVSRTSPYLWPSYKNYPIYSPVIPCLTCSNFSLVCQLKLPEYLACLKFGWLIYFTFMMQAEPPQKCSVRIMVHALRIINQYLTSWLGKYCS